MKKFLPLILVLLLLLACQAEKQNEQIINKETETTDYRVELYRSIYEGGGLENPFNTEISSITLTFISAWGFMEIYQIKNENGVVSQKQSYISDNRVSGEYDVFLTSIATGEKRGFNVDSSFFKIKTAEVWNQKVSQINDGLFEKLRSKEIDTSYLCMHTDAVNLVYFDGNDRKEINCDNCSVKCDSLLQVASKVFDVSNRLILIN